MGSRKLVGPPLSTTGGAEGNPAKFCDVTPYEAKGEYGVACGWNILLSAQFLLYQELGGALSGPWCLGKVRFRETKCCNFFRLFNVAQEQAHVSPITRGRAEHRNLYRQLGFAWCQLTLTAEDDEHVVKSSFICYVLWSILGEIPLIPGYRERTTHTRVGECIQPRPVLLALLGTLVNGLRWLLLLLLQLRRAPHLFPSVQRQSCSTVLARISVVFPWLVSVYDESVGGRTQSLSVGSRSKVRSGTLKMAPYIYMYSISVLEETGVSKAKMGGRRIWKYHAIAAVYTAGRIRGCQKLWWPSISE